MDNPELSKADLMSCQHAFSIVTLAHAHCRKTITREELEAYIENLITDEELAVEVEATEGLARRLADDLASFIAATVLATARLGEDDPSLFYEKAIPTSKEALNRASRLVYLDVQAALGSSGSASELEESVDELFSPKLSLNEEVELLLALADVAVYLMEQEAIINGLTFEQRLQSLTLHLALGVAKLEAR